MALLMKTIDFV